MTVERKPVRFSAWTPVQRDQYVGYAYTIELRYRNGLVGGCRVSPGTDRWMRAKARIAASALAMGADTFTVWGGVGSRRWRRTVTVTQDEAEAFLRDAVDGGAFMLRGVLRNALARRDRRLARAGS